MWYPKVDTLEKVLAECKAKWGELPEIEYYSHKGRKIADVSNLMHKTATLDYCFSVETGTHVVIFLKPLTARDNVKYKEDIL